MSDYPVSPWRVVCYGCEQLAPAGENMRDAVALAEDAGWRAVDIRGKRLTLCPACLQVLERKQPEVQP